MFSFIIIISACRNLIVIALLAVRVFLADKAKFVHKPAQSELQLGRSQLPYSETHQSPSPQEAAQPKHKKGPYT